MSDVKTVLTRNYYIIKKKKFDNSLLNEIREDLTVKPFVNSEYQTDDIDEFSLYEENEKKLKVPKFYGLKKIGKPDKVKKLKFRLMLLILMQNNNNPRPSIISKKPDGFIFFSEIKN